MLNWIALALFVIINALAYKLCREQLPVRRRVTQKVCWLLLGGNLFRYLIVFPFFERVIKIPAEFSAVAYFAVPLIFLSRKRDFDNWASYSAQMAGFFYYAAMILAGEFIYGADKPMDVTISLLCHGALYFIGSVSVTMERYPKTRWGTLLFGVGYVTVRAAVLRPLVLGNRRMLIYILLDAIPARFAFPESEWPQLLPGYYALVFAFILGSIAVFYRRSDAQYRRFSGLRACSAI